MFKKYIQDIAKHEARKILLSNYKEKLSTEKDWEHHYHNQVKYTETLVNKKDREILKLREDKEFLKTSLTEASEYAKSLEQENKELSSKDFITNDIHIVKLEDANSKIETIGNMVEKLINENKKSKEANSELTEKLFRIESLINYYESFKPDYYALLELTENIKNIIKES